MSSFIVTWCSRKGLFLEGKSGLEQSGKLSDDLYYTLTFSNYVDAWLWGLTEGMASWDDMPKGGGNPTSPTTMPGQQVAIEWGKDSGILPVTLSEKQQHKMPALILKEEAPNSLKSPYKYISIKHGAGILFWNIAKKKKNRKYGREHNEKAHEPNSVFYTWSLSISTKFGGSKLKQMTAT